MVTKCRYVPVMAKAKNRHRFPLKDAPPSSADAPAVLDEPTNRIASEPSDAQSSQNSRLESWLKKAQDGCLTRTDSIHLANLLIESRSWPMDKVAVDHLLAEMRAGASAMTRMVLLVWAKDAQVHSLAKLADEIIRHEQEVLASAESLFAVSELSQFLGIVRPFRSNKLNQLAQSHLLNHPELILPEGLKDSLDEAEKWTHVGLLLESSSSTERVFWNNRLRNPEMTWNWEDPDARTALRSASSFLPNAPIAVQQLFRAAVPDSWWDLMEKTCLKQAGADANELSSLHLSKKLQSKSWFSKPIKIAAMVALVGAVGAALTTESFDFRSKTPPPQILQTPSPKSVAAPVNPSFNSVKPSPSNPPPSPSHTPQLAPWRLQEIADIQQAFPALQRLQNTLHTGTLKEAEPILKGSSSIASLRTPSYQALLRWAMVDPPEDAAVRRAIIRVFTLTPPLSDTLPILEKAAGEGEPYRDEMKEMASIVLSARPMPLSTEHVERLRRIAN